MYILTIILLIKTLMFGMLQSKLLKKLYYFDIYSFAPLGILKISLIRKYVQISQIELELLCFIEQNINF